MGNGRRTSDHYQEDLTGQRFGMLIVKGPDPRDSGEPQNGKTRWMCECECGGTTTPTTRALITGGSARCRACARRAALAAVAATAGPCVEPGCSEPGVSAIVKQCAPHALAQVESTERRRYQESQRRQEELRMVHVIEVRERIRNNPEVVR